MPILTKRRGFLTGLFGVALAPTIIKVENLMPLSTAAFRLTNANYLAPDGAPAFRISDDFLSRFSKEVAARLQSVQVLRQAKSISGTWVENGGLLLPKRQIIFVGQSDV